MRRASGLLCLVLALEACGQATPPADPAQRLLRARLAAVLPDVEAELGAKFRGPIEIVASKPDEFSTRLAGNAERLLATIEGGLRGEELRQRCRNDARFPAGHGPGMVDLPAGTIRICLELIDGSAEIIPGLPLSASRFYPPFMADPAFLDLVIIHELVHLHQVRHLRLDDMLGHPRTLTQLRARRAVAEGHAEYVTRRVARRRGIEDLWLRAAEAHTQPPGDVTDPWERRSQRIALLQHYFEYVEGERLVSALVERLGYAEAVRRLFSLPPSDLLSVWRPEVYLAGGRVPAGGDQAVQRVRAVLEREADHASCSPVPWSVIETFFDPEGAGGTEATLATIREAHVVGTEAIWILCLIATDVEAAAVLERALHDAVARTHPPTATRVDESAVAVGTLFRRDFPSTYRSYLEEQDLLLRDGERVLRLVLVNPADRDEGAVRLAPRIVAALRGEPPEPPKSGDWDARWAVWRDRAADRSLDKAARGAALAEAMQDRHPAVVASAVAQMARFSLEESVPWEAYRGALTHASLRVRRAAFEVFDWMHVGFDAGFSSDSQVTPDRMPHKGPPGEVLQLLAAALDAECAFIRGRAAARLHSFSPRYEGAQPVYERAVRHPDADVREEALRALDQSGAGLPSATAELVAMARDASFGARVCAIRALARVGEASPELLALMRDLLRDAAARVRMQAAGALWVLADDPNPALAEFGSATAPDEYSGDIEQAVRVLAQLGPLAAPALSRATELLDSRSDSVRLAAVDALRAIGAAAEPAIRRLDALRRDPDRSISDAATFAAAEIRRAAARKQR